MNPLVSVVVPVYNVEPYVKVCLDSIDAQTYENVEIVIVDDGSTDNSRAVCDEFAQNSTRSVKVLVQKNSGLSAARNSGIRNCAGDFIVFVDSDDVLSRLYVEALVSVVLESGCAMATIRRADGFLDGHRPVLEEDPKRARRYVILDEVEYQKELLYQHAFNGAPWRIFRRSLIGDEYFPLGLYYEDLATTYKYVHGKGDVAVLESETLYGYRFRKGSIIRSGFSENKVKSAIVITDDLTRNIHDWYPSLDKAAASRQFSVCRLVYATLGKGHDDVRAELWKRIANTRLVVIGDTEARKREKAAAIVSCLGQTPFRVFCDIYNLYKRSH